MIMDKVHLNFQFPLYCNPQLRVELLYVTCIFNELYMALVPFVKKLNQAYWLQQFLRKNQDDFFNTALQALQIVLSQCQKYDLQI
jgi:hypothetical protein